MFIFRIRDHLEEVHSALKPKCPCFLLLLPFRAALADSHALIVGRRQIGLDLGAFGNRA